MYSVSMSFLLSMMMCACHVFWFECFSAEERSDEVLIPREVPVIVTVARAMLIRFSVATRAPFSRHGGLESSQSRARDETHEQRER